MAGKMKKILLGAAVLVGVLVIALIGVGIYVYNNLNEIVRSQTESVMTSVLGVKVTLGGAAVKVSSGDITLTDLVIYNPEGFESSHALKFGEIQVTANIPSFRTEEPTISLVRVTEPDIIYERKLRTSNLDALIENTKSKEEAPPEETTTEEEGKAIKVELIVVEGSIVRVALPMAQGKTVNVQVPDIEIRDMGEGMTPAEGLTLFLTKVLEGVAKNGEAAISGALEGVGDVAGEVGSQVEEAGRAVGDRIRGGVGGLLGGRNNDNQQEETTNDNN